MSLLTVSPPASPPLSTEARSHRPPPVREIALDGSRRVLVIRQPSMPLVHVQRVVSVGGGDDPEGLEGLAALATPFLRDHAFPPLAALSRAQTPTLETGVDWDSSFVGCILLTEEVDSILAPILESYAATEPETAFEDDGGATARSDRVGALDPTTFESQRLASQRHSRAAGLAARSRRLASVADDAFARALHGQTRYGLSLAGTAESVGRITREAVAGFARSVHEAGSTLIVAGDLEPEAIAARLGRALGEPSGGLVEERKRPAPPSGAPRTVLVDAPRAGYAELRLGHVGVARREVDTAALSLLEAILGGSFGSRLNLEIRERRGEAYGVSSSFALRRDAGPFTVATAVPAAAVGPIVRLIRREMVRLRDEPVPDRELEQARRYVVSVWTQTFQTLRGLAGLVRREIDGGGATLGDWPRRVHAVDAPALQRLAREVLHPDRAVLLAAGPAQAMRASLREAAADDEPPWTEKPRERADVSIPTSIQSQGGAPLNDPPMKGGDAT